MTILGAVLIASLVLTSCGTKDAKKDDAKHETTDPKKNGEKAGKLMCKLGELKEEIEDLDDDIHKLDWDDDDEREEIADLEKDKFKLERKGAKLWLDMAKLENKQWSATEHEDDIKDWNEDYRDAKNDYVEDNCKGTGGGRY